MAPEQVLGQPVDRRADIYALGILLCQLLTGRPPFDAATPVEIEEMHLAAPPPKLSELAAAPPAIDEVVARCLAKARDDRYDGVAELLADLQRAAAGAKPDPSRPKRSAIVREQAVAIYVRIDTDVPDDELDDTVLDDVEQIGELVREAGRGAGFEIIEEGSGSLLAIRTDRVVDPKTSELQSFARRGAAIRVGLDLRDAIAKRASAHRAVHAAIAIHAGDVIRVATTGGGKPGAIVGGNVIGAGTWKTASARGIVVVTAEAIAELEPQFEVGAPEGPARLRRVVRKT
jgi:serine/threonine-protein kinase